MYEAFLAVLTDLWLFAIGRAQSTQSLPALSTPSASQAAAATQTRVKPDPLLASTLAGKMAYVQEPAVHCLQTPQKKFDAKRGELSYATAVRVVREQNGWVFVETNSQQGWVLDSSITEDERVVYPQLQAGVVYDAAHPETIKLRRSLQDELLGGELALPLQSSEYILYRLARAQKTVLWPMERPRLPGMWQSLLKGRTGVVMSLEPKTGAILEYSGTVGNRFLGYVESVTPDQKIVLSSIGRVETGVFEKTEFLPADWQAWRPVFISFT